MECLFPRKNRNCCEKDQEYRSCNPILSKTIHRWRVEVWMFVKLWTSGRSIPRQAAPPSWRDFRMRLQEKWQSLSRNISTGLYFSVAETSRFQNQISEQFRRWTLDSSSDNCHSQMRVDKTISQNCCFNSLLTDNLLGIMTLGEKVAGFSFRSSFSGFSWHLKGWFVGSTLTFLSPLTFPSSPSAFQVRRLDDIKWNDTLCWPLWKNWN